MNILDRKADFNLNYFFKPVIESNENLIKSINYQQWHSLPELDVYGPLATRYLSKYVNKERNTDSTYGINYYDNKFNIGDITLKIQDNDLIIDGDKYLGTRGLWELLVLKQPKTFTQEDLDKYAIILQNTNAMHRKSKI